MTAQPKPPSGQEGFFWKTKTLEEMSNVEWESLCDGCARCCLEKLEDEDTGKIYFTHVSCKLLDAGLCACKDYANRSDQVPDCVRLTPENVRTLNWLPPSCGYKLVAEGRDLYWWHPLISGDPNTVHEAGVSVRGRVQGTEDEIAGRRPRGSHRAMAGAVAEAGPAEEAAAILAAAGTGGQASAIVASRDAPMRVTRCRSLDFPLTHSRIQRFRAASAAPRYTRPHEQVRTAGPSPG